MINYWVSSEIWLSLEDYYNKGITPKRAKELIESISDARGRKLNCRESGINDNWIVKTMMNNPDDHTRLVWKIESLLEDELLTCNLKKMD